MGGWGRGLYPDPKLWIEVGVKERGVAPGLLNTETAELAVRGGYADAEDWSLLIERRGDPSGCS